MQPWCAVWVVHLRAYAAAMAVLEPQPVFRRGGGAAYLERVAELLSETPFGKCRWHGLRRGAPLSPTLVGSLAQARHNIGVRTRVL